MQKRCQFTMLKESFKSTYFDSIDWLGIMTILILFGLENVMRAGLICHSNVEHGKMVKEYTLKIDETQSEYSKL